MDLITVYITNYNYGHFIKQAIESVLRQENVRFELLIIDDGSTDHSKEIIEQYRLNDEVRIIYQKNKGLNVTNNIALNLSQGKYIMRLDADDYLQPDALYLLSSTLDQHQDVGLVFPDYYTVDEIGNILEHHQRHDFAKEVSLYDQAAHGACTMIRVSALKELGGYNENYKCQDGYELWVKFTHKFKVLNVNKPLFSYRQHGTNLTGDENRILGTRAKINADYIKEFNIENSSLAVIPVRSRKDKYVDLPWEKSNLLSFKIKEALKSKVIKHLIITSPDQEVENFIENELLNLENVSFIKRSQESAEINVSLDKSISEILSKNNLDDLFKKVSSLIILDLQFPLISAEKMDDAVNTMLLFNADSLISVRQENNTIYKHNGSGMKSILTQDHLNRFERDIFYKHVGGITACKLSNFHKHNKIIYGKVGHLILDKNSSYKIENKLDLAIVKQINKLYKII